MKKYHIIILFFAGILLFNSCEKNILDKTPVDRYSDATVWTDIKLADLNLLEAYNALESDVEYRTLADCTEETHSTHMFGSENYTSGSINPDNPMPFDGGGGMAGISWETQFKWIQRINTFLSSIDKVPDAYTEPRKTEIMAIVNRMKGEARFLRAYCYQQLVCNYGGVPIMDKANKLNDDFSTLKRATFEETVNFIVADCNAAFDQLDDNMEMGRATKGATLALKSRVLLFAASDLTADGTAANNLVGYTSPNRTALWTSAKTAAKAVMDLDLYDLEDFGAPDRKAIAKNYFGLFKSKTLASKEIIWGKMFLSKLGVTNFANLFHGSNGFVDWGCSAPTQNLVDLYQMEDGSDFFEHFALDNNKYYRNLSVKFTNENIYYNRDPRFYGTILYDSAKWLNRYEDLVGLDPLGIYDRRTRIIIQGGEEISKIFGIDTQGGPVDGEDATYTGYVMKKNLDDECYSQFGNNENVWVELRYAEVLLNYAEACLELGETGEATTYINMIRNRAGMPDFTGDITKALHYERHIELALEGRRWYDIRRWKILDQVIVNTKGIDIVEIKNLDNGTTTTTWQQIDVEERGPIQSKMYWLPIARAEINRAPQLENNPGY